MCMHICLTRSLKKPLSRTINVNCENCNMYMYLATFVCVAKKCLQDFCSGFSNVRGHKPVSYVLFRYKCDLYVYLYVHACLAL